MTNWTTDPHPFATDGEEFSLAPFDTVLQPLIAATLQEVGKDQSRKGTKLIPTLLTWFVLALTLRRDLNYHKVLNWLGSGLRWVAEKLPATNNLVSDGALTHARVRLGLEVFEVLWNKLLATLPPLEPDFHGYISAAFDGSTATMPDTPENQAEFGKPRGRSGSAAFPQTRLMSLLAVSSRRLLGLAYAAYTGKGTGERALMLTILSHTPCTGLLLLLDAGLYALSLLWEISQRDGAFLVKVPAHVTFRRTQRLADGSWLALVTGKILDPDIPPSPTGRRHWKTVQLEVRVIRVEVKGFRPFWLMTSLLDPDIPAREIALHYHRRWDLEVAYDEIKTHQCATLRGQPPTIFRSKLPLLVKQEIYALGITYTVVRVLMADAAALHNHDPTHLSFLDALQHILDAAPLLTAAAPADRAQKRAYLLEVLADCRLDRPRRARVNPRVVRVKMSKFARKRAKHIGQKRDMAEALRILEVEAPQPG